MQAAGVVKKQQKLYGIKEDAQDEKESFQTRNRYSNLKRKQGFLSGLSLQVGGLVGGKTPAEQVKGKYFSSPST